MTGGDVGGGAVGGGAVTVGGAGGGDASGGVTADGVVTGVEDGSAADPPSPTVGAAVADAAASVTGPSNPEEAMASGVGTTAAGASTPGRPIEGTHGAPVNAAITASR